MKKICVFVSGHFNILHTGHIRLLQFAKELGDYLIVGVESDEIAGDAAHINEKYRLEGVKLNNLVDEVILFDEPIINVVKKLKPDIIVKGKEHELRFNPEPITFEKSIKLENLSFKYNQDGAIVLKYLNMTLEKGKRYGFIGTTGCGKSTLLDVIMGLLNPTKGHLRIDDKVLGIIF